MSAFQRIKNLIELSRFQPAEPSLKEVLDGKNTVELREVVKAPTVRRMATVVQDDPIDLFTEDIQQ